MMTIPAFSLRGKAVLVTGARRGIGRTLALGFAEAGADVAVCDLVIDDGRLESVAEDIRSLGRRSFSIQADTSRKSDVDKMIQRIVQEFGALDILVNNAGTALPGPLLDLSEEAWDRVIQVNLKGYFLCAQAAGRVMMEQRSGVIICTASQYAFKAAAGMGVYCISKAGVAMLIRVLARELGGYGIRVNGIAPGLVKTDMSRNDWEDPEIRAQREAVTPLGRLAETDDLVGAALFLASDASAYVSGHIILVDGGEIA
jgi:NAD(P)-dependent dehydrogenase (short-subunit alcohol dehydrogenase family)